MAAEQFTNQAHTGVTEPVDSSETSITVGDASNFPTSGDFRVVCEQEIMVCTSRTGNTLTVVRGQDGTTATTHPSGARIAHVITVEGLRNYIRPDVALFQDTANIGYHSLSNYGQTQILTAADFTWRNQDTATRVDNDDGSISMYAPGNVSVNELRIQVRSAPTNKPWKVTASIIPQLHFNNSAATTPMVGMGVRDSGNGRLWVIWQTIEKTGVFNDRFVVSDFSNDTTFVTNFTEVFRAGGRELVRFQIEHQADNNIVFRASPNGFDWLDISTQDAGAAGRTFDEVFWYLNAGSSITASNQFDTYGTLIGWSEEDA